MMDFEQIEKYCNQEMSVAERANFEKQMQADQKLTDTVAAYQLIDAEMREVPASADALIKTLDQLGEKHFRQSETPVIPLKAIWRITAIAACVAGLLLVGRWLLIPENITKETLLARHFTVETISLTERGISTDTLYQVELFFNAGQPEKVLLWLKPYLVSHPEPEFQMVLIKSLLRLNQSKEAINLAAKVAAGESALKYEAMLLQATGYIQVNDWNQAQIILKQIPESAIEYKKAQALLKDMELVKK